MTASQKEQEFRKLMTEHGGLVAKVCYMYATDSEHFKDLLQEVRINIWQAIDKFRGESAISTWLYRITVNTCVSCYRRYNRHDAETRTVDPEQMLALANMATTDHERLECLHELYALINRLPALDKAIIMMWLDERPYQEIAEVTGLSRNNVATRINRCKRKLLDMSNS